MDRKEFKQIEVRDSGQVTVSYAVAAPLSLELRALLSWMSLCC